MGQRPVSYDYLRHSLAGCNVYSAAKYFIQMLVNVYKFKKARKCIVYKCKKGRGFQKKKYFQVLHKKTYTEVLIGTVQTLI